MKNTILLLVVSVAPCLLLAEKSAPDYSEAFRLIDTWLAAQRAYDRLPGLSAGVVRDQQLIWSHGYGLADTERKVAAEPDTVYSICSISKLFTSVAILQLRDAGKLRLDDRLASEEQAAAAENALSGLDLFPIQQSWNDAPR